MSDYLYTALTLLVLSPVVLLLLTGFSMGLATGLLVRKKAGWLNRRKRRPVIHLRGNIPGTYRDIYCEGCGSQTMAEFIDQDTRAWCARHLPANTVSAERAISAGNGHGSGECTVHGMDCPKPWSSAYR